MVLQTKKRITDAIKESDADALSRAPFGAVRPFAGRRTHPAADRVKRLPAAVPPAPFAVVLFLLFFVTLLKPDRVLAQLPAECSESNGQVVCIYEEDDTFTVPSGVSSITVQAWGAGGGGGRGDTQSGAAGGGGGFVQGTFEVTPEGELTVRVGGAGLGGTESDGRGGSGGGFSGLFDGSVSQGNAFLIAGGGGGGGGGANHSRANGATAGGAGGGDDGIGASGIGGGGGTQGAGGAGGTGGRENGSGGNALQGGEGGGNSGMEGGGNGGGGSGDGAAAAGGGGGGWYGGGGGAAGTTTGSPTGRQGGGGGGGGSGFVHASGIGVQNIAGSGSTPANEAGEHYVSGRGAGGGGSAGNANAGNGGAGLVVIIYDIIEEDGPFFSRQSGEWVAASTWSRVDFGGDAASTAPGEEDDIRIGGSGGSGHVIELTEGVTINDPGTLQILDTGDGAGALVTGTHIVSGSGEFFLDDGGTLQIGSPDGIAASGSSGNIQTGSRSFALDAHYVYNGTVEQVTGTGLPATVANLTIDNAANVISTEDVHKTVNGTLNLQDGILVMAPGTSLATFHVEAEEGGAVRMQLEMDGLFGYRMISSPVGTDYDDLLENFIVQGIAGRNWPDPVPDPTWEDRQPNMLWFEEEATEAGTTANASWRTIGAMGDATPAGRGYFFYIFGDMTDDNPVLDETLDGDYDQPLPRMMSATGVESSFEGENPDPFDFGITFTDVRGEGFEHLHGWNLIGNPTTATLDWDNDLAWTRENVDLTIYVWDPSANDGAGDYLTWNTETGSLPNEGLISPFQSFWVKADGEDTPSLTVTQDAKVMSGEFVGSYDPALLDAGDRSHTVLDFTLRQQRLESKLFVAFSEEGVKGRDRYDAYRLQPPGGASHLIFFTTSGGSEDPPLAINNLPRDFEGTLRIPLQVGGKRGGDPVSGEFELTWSLPPDWPASWAATLMDHKTREAIPMQHLDRYTFHHDTPSGSVLLGESGGESGSQNLLSMPDQIVMEERAVSPMETAPALMSVENLSRFTILVEPGGNPDNPEYSPDRVELLQNRPNPFRQTTTIPVGLPEMAEISLDLYDMLGRRVKTIASGSYPAGVHYFDLDAAGLASGIYIYRLVADGVVRTRKLVLVN